MSSPRSEFHQEVKGLTLSGSGETREAALNGILTKMRQQINQEVNGPILFMAPVGLEVLTERIERKEERFLGLLWPRTRTRCHLELQIQVEVRWVEFLD